VHIEKAPLPKGKTYVLKSSVLEQALLDAGFTLPTQLVHTAENIFFEAQYSPPNPDVPQEQLLVRAGAVASGFGYAARQAIETAVIPEFIEWLRSFLTLPENSPLRRDVHNFYRRLPTQLTEAPMLKSALLRKGKR
jgi:hypothetical protein